MCNVGSHKMNPETWAVPKSNTLMRHYFTETGRTPTVAEIRANVGSLIADALFSVVPQELKECVGLEPKMKGPKESMWCSPSDQLLGELKLSIVPSQRHAHAITHQAILEIGGDIEQTMRRMMEDELRMKLEEQQKLLQQMFDEKVQSVRRKVIREFFELSALKLRELFNQMEADFKEEWKKRETHLLTEAEKERIQGIKLVEEAMKCELNNVTRLHEDKFKSQLNFLVEVGKSNAHDEYHQKLIEHQRKTAKLFQNFQEAEKLLTRKRLAELRASMESEMYTVITRERQYMDEVLYEVVKYGQNNILTVKEEIIKLKDKLEESNKQKELFANDVGAWMCVVRDLFAQFQKFINFVLQEIPSQAEYLLSLTEIMNKRKECLRKKWKNSKRHDDLGHCKDMKDNWEDTLVRPAEPSSDENIEWKSTVDLSDEDDDRRKSKDARNEDEHLKQLLEHKEQDRCTALLESLAQWVLHKMDGTKLTPPPSSLNSTKSEESMKSPQSPVTTIDPEVIQYVEYVKNCLPTASVKRGSREDQQNSQLNASSPINKQDTIKMISRNLEQPECSPDRFVSKRINSILDILDAHPYIKNALGEL